MQAMPTPSQAHADETPGPRAGQHELPPSILVVEDDPASLEALVTFLRIHGYDALTAASGEEGLEVLAQRDDVTLVLCDVRMPGISGIEFYARARQHKPGINVVLLTGDPDSAESVLRTGMLAVLKPYDFDILKRVINEALESPRDA